MIKTQICVRNLVEDIKICHVGLNGHKDKGNKKHWSENGP